MKGQAGIPMDLSIWLRDQDYADYSEEVLRIFRPALAVIRSKVLGFPEVPFYRNWTKASEWLVETASQSQPTKDPREVRRISGALRKLNQRTGMKWALGNGTLHLRFVDEKGGSRFPRVDARSSLGRATAEVEALADLANVTGHDLWRMMLTGEEPKRISPITIRRVTREYDVPGIGPTTLHSVELFLLTPRLKAHDFRLLPEAVRSTWGRDCTDAGYDVVNVVEGMGGHPLGFPHGERTRFWCEVADELQRRGVRNAQGRWFKWPSAEAAYYRIRPADKPERRKRRIRDSLNNGSR